MASPVKSLSFKKAADGSFCIHKKVKRGNYKSVADFWFEIESFVQFQGALNKHSGYIFQVHKTLGENNVSNQKFACEGLSKISSNFTLQLKRFKKVSNDLKTILDLRYLRFLELLRKAKLVNQS